MQSDAFISLIRPTETIRRILRLALSAAIALYVLVLFVMFGAPSGIDEGLSHPAAIPLVVAAIVAGLLSRWLPGRIVGDARLREILAGEPNADRLATDPQTGKVNESRRDEIKRLSGREQRLLVATQALVVPFIVQLALQESIALFGLVLGFLSRSVAPMIPFAAVALFLNLTLSPKLDADLERAARLCPIA